MEEKRLSANILAYHVAHHPGSRVFGHKETKGLKLAEMWVRTVGMGSVGVELSEAERGGRRQALEGQTICEITVDEGEQDRLSQR
ncbi:hypothetical protein A0H81_09565 [Grifola frondosa]|uniref:Uncharacterized protein n=1 Tax=Grifola frondosa TaxID=5627 RepID=A0A1C7M0N4_GRIFR|nr:hypothetical protein A0H81_09565 [Grifola frondosa]